MRPLGPLAALLLLTIGLAGCTALGAGDTLTAHEAHGIARDAALAWHGDAVVSRAVGTELARFVSEEREVNISDPAVGDGRASVWVVVFISPSDEQDAFVVVVLGNRTILSAEPTPRRIEARGGGAYAVTEFVYHAARDWRVDSTRAVGIASANETWRRIQPTATAVGHVLFGGNDTNPVWVLGITNRPVDERGRLQERANGTESVQLYIDATTGDLLPERPAWIDDLVDARAGFDGGAGGMPPEMNGFGGQVTLLEPEGTHDFRIQPGHATLEVVVRPSPPVPLNGATVTLHMPGGATQEDMVDTSPARIQVEQPAGGEYRVEVRLRDGAAVRYDGCWVASSGPGVPGFPGFPGTCG